MYILPNCIFFFHLSDLQYFVSMIYTIAVGIIKSEYNFVCQRICFKKPWYLSGQLYNISPYTPYRTCSKYSNMFFNLSSTNYACEGLRSTYASFMAGVCIYIVNFYNTILNKLACKCHVKDSHGYHMRTIPGRD